MLRGRRGARLTALTSGGTIPDTADYQVLLEPENQFIGTVNEDFAVESMAGDVFQLGNTSYRILRVERGMVRVEDAHGMPPTIPFWLGEAPGRSDELSLSVSRLRGGARRAPGGRAGRGRRAALADATRSGSTSRPPPQLVEYLAAAHAALGCLPTQDTIVLERFFDEAGGMQLVIHSPFGSRINRAWGLALRKRFCRKFNFELQAAATEDNIVLSLTTAHSFELAEVCALPAFGDACATVLIQALLDAPMFITRWRWVAGVSLALPRFRGGKKVPPQLARMDAEDLIAAVFPDQLACAENLAGEREIPDHPLVAPDHRRLPERGDGHRRPGAAARAASSPATIGVVARDLTEPSPLALEVLSARPYAYLDDAPLEERRTQAVMSRRWLAPEDAADLGRLDPEAIARVRERSLARRRERRRAARCAGLARLPDRGGSAGRAGLERLARRARAASGAWRGCIGAGRRRCGSPPSACRSSRRCGPRRELEPGDRRAGRADARGLVARRRAGRDRARPARRARAGHARPRSRRRSGSSRATSPPRSRRSRPKASPCAAASRRQAGADEWCERRLLARIHRYTVKRLRAEIEPVAARDFLRFLFDWQRVARGRAHGGAGRASRRSSASSKASRRRPAPGRPRSCRRASPTTSRPGSTISASPGASPGRGCGRATAAANGGERSPAPVRTTPITLLARRHAAALGVAVAGAGRGRGRARGRRRSPTASGEHGASFFDELVEGTGLLRSQVEEALAELVALGLVTSDSFGGLRALLVPSDQRKPARRRAGAAAPLFGMEDAGRWALARRARPPQPAAQADPRRSSTSRARCCAATAWCSGACSSARPTGCRRGATCCASTAGSRRAARSAAAASSPASPASSSRCPRRSARCARCGASRPPDAWVSVSGADPLNLVGILTPGPKLAALTGNRLLYRDGLPIALLAGGEVQFLETLDAGTEWQARKALLRGAVPAPLTGLA